MVREFKLPDVGEGVAEGEIVTWLVEEGDEVSEDQAVAEVETDKAIVEVPSPVNGTVREILAEEGEMVKVGSVIITFDVEGEEAEPAETESAESEQPTESQEEVSEEPEVSETEEAGAAGGEAEEISTGEGRVFAAPSARRLARELGVDIASVEGTGPSGRVTEHDVRTAAESGGGAGAEDAGDAEAEFQPAEVEEPEPDTGGVDAAGGAGDDAGAGGAGGAAGGAGTTGGAPAQVESADREKTLAAPATRRIAEEQGVDINAVPATEKRDGQAFVTPEAVNEYAEAQQQAQAADAAAVASGETGPREERIPYKGIRKTIGEAMSRSKFTAPHVTHHDTAVVEDLVATRERLKPKAEERGIRLTYMPFVMKAVVAALKQHPKLNAALDEEASEIVRKNYYNVGVAAATDAGLMVPVVENVDGKGLLQLSSEVNEVVQKARDRSISREELQGSTFTITNFGAIGGEYATPILNHPEVGILGIGELKQRPVVEDGEVVAKHTLPISLSIDHRIVDGADAAAFANTFIEYVENPELLLLE